MITGTVHALGFSRWKRRPLRLCLSGCAVKFVADVGQVPDGATVAVWGMRAVPDAAQRNIALIRVEDGFLRSVGLGADLIRPLSWVVDRRGIYFNADQASDLEVLLGTTEFPADLIERAAALRLRVVAAGLTKYNVGASAWRRPLGLARVILVPGQVESDASIEHGAPAIKTNVGLLHAVRTANPSAYVVYKPHPDVVAGLRKPGRGEAEVARWADEVVVDASMGPLLQAVDEVHCLTSLAGFEALLRGKRVSCYGQPFYAGWGLTQDVVPVRRRQRKLSLDELVAAALILYPVYISRNRDALISPEDALAELVAWQARSTGAVPWWRRAIRLVLRRVVGVR